MSGPTWNLPDVQRDIAVLMAYVVKDRRLPFNKTLLGFSADHASRLWVYLATMLVGILKANDPVRDGLTLDLTDVHTLDMVCKKHAEEPFIAHLVFQLVAAVAADSSPQVKAFFTDNYRDKNYKAVKAVFWTLGKAVQWTQEGSAIHSTFALRAAMLRLIVFHSLKYVRQHEWSEADLTAAADLAAMLDDSTVKLPGDDWI